MKTPSGNFSDRKIALQSFPCERFNVLIIFQSYEDDEVLRVHAICLLVPERISAALFSTAVSFRRLNYRRQGRGPTPTLPLTQ